VTATADKNEPEEEHREPWKCLFHDSHTEIEDALCTRCENTIESLLGTEKYSVESVSDGYRFLGPDQDDSYLSCKCGCEVFEVQFADLCSYHRRQASK